MTKPKARARRSALAAILAGVAVAAAARSETEPFPAWAFPGSTLAKPAGGWDTAKSLSAPGSPRAFTEARVHDLYAAPDWFPDRHPPAPRIVLTGRAGQVMACGYCHLPDGSGRPENAAVSGLPADDIRREVAALRSGQRTSASPGWTPTDLMAQVAGAGVPAAGDPRPGRTAGAETGRGPGGFRAVRAARSDTRLYDLCAARGARAGPEPGPIRRRGPDHRLRHLSRRGFEGRRGRCRTASNGPLAELPVPPAVRLQDRRARRRGRPADAPGRRQALPGRHDRARRLCGIAGAVRGSTCVATDDDGRSCWADARQPALWCGTPESPALCGTDGGRQDP